MCITNEFPAKSQSGAYLFVFFIGNKPEEERLHFALSKDGYNFTEINGGEPVVIQQKGKKCVRDPYILKGQDGAYHIIGTDMKCEEGWLSNHALVTWRSEDLVNWTDETILDIHDFGGEFKNTTRAWAPQAIWDGEKKQYMIYWANSTVENDNAAIYYAYTSDFKTMTTPQYLYGREGIQTIDADIVKSTKNGKYYMYFKHDETQTIAFVAADKLTGPYKDEPVIVSLSKHGVEGSEMYNITGTDKWIMIMDEYGNGRFFAQQTSDFEHFEALPSESYKYTDRPRHGSIIAISDEEYERLLKYFRNE